MRQLLTGFLLLLATPAVPCLVAGDYGPRLDAIVASYHDAGDFQGAVLVALDDEVILRKAYGYADIELGVKNTPETRFAAASLGKALTAAMILQLMDEGKLSLDDPLSKHLPDFPGHIAGKVTLHQMLSHTAGIPWPQDDWSREQFVNSYTLDELVAGCGEGQLQFEPGSKFSYCNCCYHLAAAVVEAITGNDFESELKRHVLDPLGMNDTGIVRRKPILERRASGYEQTPDGGLENVLQEDQSYALGAGGIYTTVDDLYKWDRALYGDELLSAESRDLMFTKHEHGSGYGWAIGAYGKKNVGEERASGTYKLALGFGGTPGYASAAARLLDDRYFIVFLGNMRQIPQNQLMNDLWNTILGLDVEPLDGRADADPATSPLEVVEALMRAFNEHDVDAMLAHVTEDVEWMSVPAEGASLAVEATGKSALRERMMSYFEGIPSARAVIEDWMASSDDGGSRFVTVRERASWTSKESGDERSQTSIAVYEIRDSLVARVWYYPAE